MDVLIAYLRGCFDEEQVQAEAALKRTTTTRRMIQGRWVEDRIQPAEWRRSAWSPKRVLAEIDAKRRTLVRCEEELMAGIPRLTHFIEQTLRELALPYASRPDYPGTLAS